MSSFPILHLKISVNQMNPGNHEKTVLTYFVLYSVFNLGLKAEYETKYIGLIKLNGQKTRTSSIFHYYFHEAQCNHASRKISHKCPLRQQ